MATMLSMLCFGAAIVGCCSCADRIGQVLGVIDHPDGVRKRHRRPTPLVGGIALMLPLLAMIIGQMATQVPALTALFSMLAVAALGFMVLGWTDDRHALTPASRLLIGTAICVGVLLIEPGFRLTTLEFGRLVIPLGIMAVPFSVLCLVGLQNAINMTDGMNGLVIGLASFWTACLLLYAPDHLSVYLWSLLLGLVILLPYNLLGRLFLGDAGSYSIGITVGLLMIYVQGQSGGELRTITVMVWLLIPVVDCLRVMVTRFARASSPLEADRNHLHHRLAIYWPWPISVMIYLAIATLPGFVAAVWPSMSAAMLIVALLAYGSLVWLTSGHSRQLASAGRLGAFGVRPGSRVEAPAPVGARREPSIR